MEVLVGTCLAERKDPAIGRLVLCDTVEAVPTRGAFLAVYRHFPDRIGEYEGQMGVILLGDADSSQAALPSATVPVLRISELSDGCLGKIGVLDPSSATLFVSPDLPTVGRYLSYWNRSGYAGWERVGLRPDGVRLCLCQRENDLPIVTETDRLLDLRGDFASSDDEELLYERICALADCATGIPVTVAVAFSRAERERDGFRAAVRGIFRAAVYGRISMLIGGCLTEEDWQRARQEIHGAFCELKEEGREFNGYIPKGLLVEHPITLLSLRRVEGLDFWGLEIEALWKRLCGIDWEELADEDPLWKHIEELLRKLIGQGGGVRAYSILRTEAPTRAMYRLLRRCGLEDCFFVGKGLDAVKERLRELMDANEESAEKFFEEN
jgi:hypothetical protein